MSITLLYTIRAFYSNDKSHVSSKSISPMTFQIKPRKTFSDDNNNNIKQFYIILVYLIQSKPERKKKSQKSCSTWFLFYYYDYYYDYFAPFRNSGIKLVRIIRLPGSFVQTCGRVADTRWTRPLDESQRSPGVCVCA